MTQSLFGQGSQKLSVDAVVDIDMARISKIASATAWSQAITLKAKNADAPEGQMWSLEANAYVNQPTCDAGYHFSLDTYKCEPN